MPDALLWEELPLDFTNPADTYREKDNSQDIKTNKKRITTRFSTQTNTHSLTCLTTHA